MPSQYEQAMGQLGKTGISLTAVPSNVALTPQQVKWALDKMKGASRLESISPTLRNPFEQMMNDAPEHVRKELSLTSGFRTREEQEDLYRRKPHLAAKPGHSKHEIGEAFDLGFASPATKAWVHENAGRYGLGFPVKGEDWHLEPITATGPGTVGSDLQKNAVAAAPAAAPAAPAAAPATPPSMLDQIAALAGGGDTKGKGAGGLADLAAAFKPRAQAQSDVTTIQPTNLMNDPAQAAQSQQAQQMMASLLADRRKKMGTGLNLMG